MYKYCCRHWVLGVVLLAAIPGIHLVFSQSRVHFLHPHQRMAELLEHTQSKSPVVNATSTQKTSLIGVPNFGRVTPTLYRGGQPTLEGLRQLRALGVEIVINLRNEQNEIETERREVEERGLQYISMPWNASYPPDSRAVRSFVELIQANPGKKVFVHCWAGRDRTGVMIAVFRIAMQGWTPARALDEMEAFGYGRGTRRFRFRHLKAYVERFPELLSRDPQLCSLQLTHYDGATFRVLEKSSIDGSQCVPFTLSLPDGPSTVSDRKASAGEHSPH